MAADTRQINTTVEAFPLPDAPFRIGKTGKFKLLVVHSEKKYDRYEYELRDAEGKTYHAESPKKYPESQLLRCIVTFDIKSASLIVSNTVICKKQDLVTFTPDIKKGRPRVQPNASHQSYTAPSPFTNPDEPQNPGENSRPMTEDEVRDIISQIESGRGKRDACYHCCGKSFHGLFNIRKHLHECHPREYVRYFVTELHGSAPPVLRGVGVKVSKPKQKRKSSSRNKNAYPPRCKGDHFHLIYTPMGNKR